MLASVAANTMGTKIMIGLASRFCKVVCGMVLPVSLLALCIDAAAEVGVQPPRGDNVGQPGFQSPVVKSRTRSDGRSIYLIRLEQAPVASYRGGLRGLASTSPEVMGELKLDVRSAEARAYRAFLEDRQEQILDAITQRVGHEPETVYRYYYGNNGMAVWLTADEAAQVRELPGVISVQRDTKRQLHTDAGPAWIGASDLWAGSGGLSPTQGEGIVMGVIDTGINPSNPSFADVGADGYDHTNPRGASNYVGVCNPGDPGYDVTFPCNDKLIGAWGYPTVNGGDPRDYNRHGSHTASTAAGNHVDAVLVAPTVNLAARISGVAPHANIIAYAGCCTASALAAAIDHAIADGVDVINYSIGSGLASDA
ncbi:MAG TPA: hypothetical protein EYP40_07240, partial [Chromatiales bacterium]|nr:hypothetical protein [Chromatiales bacterium]